jgi:hypothetical protein
MKGLVIGEPWISLIISGQKTWDDQERVEINNRYRAALCPSCRPSELKAGVGNHRVPESAIGKDFKHSTAWVLQHARPLREPVPTATLPAR